MDIQSGSQSIILAGATGDLGGRIARSLLSRGAKVNALVRNGSSPDKVAALRNDGITVTELDFDNSMELTKACQGGTCVVSALSGLEDVIVGVQGQLLQAALEAGVPRFIPSDFAVDFTKLSPGTNRNLDLRLKFMEQLNKSPIAATSILNGMFTDLLTGQAPFIIFPLKCVIHWGDADQLMDFTTIADTAAYTAAAALDSSTPRYLRIAGDVVSARGLQKAASDVTGNKFRLIKVGGLAFLDSMISITRAVTPKNREVLPPWQGMQYMRNMFSGWVKLNPLDNDRYPNIHWTTVKEVLHNRV